MTIDEAIAHAQETADTRTDLCDECREEHRQLAQWLIELKQLREENDTLKTEIMAVKSGSDVLKICKLEEENKELKRLLRLGTGELTMNKLCKICGKIKNMFSWEDTCYSCQKQQELKRIQEEIKAGKEKVDTFSTDYVICPYCGYAHETCYGYEDFPELYDEDDHEIECYECGKTFVLETTVSYSWKTRRADNGKV